MDQNEKKYEKISDEMRKQKEEEYYEEIVGDFRREEIEEGFHKYEVVLQDIKFVVGMTDEELRKAIGLAIDFLEEMKEMNNNGLNKEALERVIEELGVNPEENITNMLKVWNKISTDKMTELIAEADQVTRVGGAWAMILANPGLVNAIYVVYERLVDNFDNEELYDLGGYFLLRGIMKMHSNEVDSFE